MSQVPVKTSQQIFLWSKDADREYSADTEKNSNLRFNVNNKR